MTAAPPTSELAAFLEARLSEDEAAAREAADAQGRDWADEEGVVSSATAPTLAPGDMLYMYAPEGRWMLWDCEGSASLGVAPPTSAHIARHDPARVLAQVAALRAVVTDHSPVSEGKYCGRCRGVEFEDGDVYESDYAYYPCPTLRHVAAIWASNPAFDPAWSA